MFEDELLLWKFKRGSTDALKRLYDKYEVYLISVATALLNDTHGAEDLLHDFFVSFVKSADKVRIKGNLKAYFATCIANLARNRLKRIKLEPGELGDSAESRPCGSLSVEQAAMQREETLMLNSALAQLPYQQREVIVLHLQGDMKFTQISRQTGISVNTIRSRYRYGLDKLRNILNSEDEK